MIADSNQSLQQKFTSLGPISDTSMELLLNLAKRRKVLKGEIILRCGEVCNKIIYVEEGCLRTYFDKDGIDINTDFCFENNFTTNLKSLRSMNPSESATEALEPTVLYEFEKDKLLDLYKLSPEIESLGRKLIEQLLEGQEEHAQWFKLYSPKERYIYLQDHKPEYLQRISLSQLASYLGITRETLSRIRKRNT